MRVVQSVLPFLAIEAAVWAGRQAVRNSRIGGRGGEVEEEDVVVVVVVVEGMRVDANDAMASKSLASPSSSYNGVFFFCSCCSCCCCLSL